MKKTKFKKFKYLFNIGVKHTANLVHKVVKWEALYHQLTNLEMVNIAP